MESLYDSIGLTDFQKVLPAINNYLRETARYKTNTYNLSPELESEITSRLGKIIEKYGYSVPS